MGVIGERIEEQVGETEARKVIVIGLYVRRKDQSFGRNAPHRSFAFQIVYRARVWIGEPQDASLHRDQDTHPHIEQCRREFVIVVETAKDEAGIRQTRLDARRYARRNLSLVVRWQIAVRQISNLLPVMDLLLRWNHRGIGQDVVHPWRAGGSPIAKI